MNKQLTTFFKFVTMKRQQKFTKIRKLCISHSTYANINKKIDDKKSINNSISEKNSCNNNKFDNDKFDNDKFDNDKFDNDMFGNDKFDNDKFDNDKFDNDKFDNDKFDNDKFDNDKFDNNMFDNTKKSEYYVHDLGFMKNILSNRNVKFSESYCAGNNINDNNIKNVHKTNNMHKERIITIILNNKLCNNSANIIENSDLLVCADGGANHLYNLCHKNDKIVNDKIVNDKIVNEHTNNYNTIINKKINKQINYTQPHSHKTTDSNILTKEKNSSFKLLHNIVPNIICGDLDSIHKHVLNYYINKSVKFEKCSGQNDTDMDKCIKIIKKYTNINDRILILGGTGNRFDHTCANISSLYKNEFLNNLYLLGENNFIFLLKKGKNIINLNFEIFDKICGLIPFNQKCKLKTKGLKYNLNYEYLSFDTLVSSSNEAIQNSICIYNNSPIIWCSLIRDDTC
ncbi:thiamine pyrophosphokinase [Hepatocystis sp. ex Piliocolobus tephrosceles]|nr:thiamine pyrophosphokinase [Hepatocystis sp. ex Piliocolobus tephrosceles]